MDRALPSLNSRQSLSLMRLISLTFRPASKLDHDISSPDAGQGLLDSPPEDLAKQNRINEPQLKRHKSILFILTNKLRTRPLAPEVHLDETPDGHNLRRKDSRARAVPISLPNDIVSKGRRLLPPIRSPDLSAIEADEDRRIDALQSDVSSSVCDNRHSEAKDIAQSWRIDNTKWLLTDEPLNLTLEVTPPVIDSQESRSSDLTLFSTPSSERLGQPLSPSPEVELLPGIATEGLFENAKAHSTPSAPSPSPSLSKSMLSLAIPVALSSQASLPLSLQRPVSPSRQPEESRPLQSPVLPPSPSVPAPTRTLPAPPQGSVDDVSPPSLRLSVSDTLSASPLSPTPPSLLCSPSSESEESTMTSDNGEINASHAWSTIKGRRDGSPVALKCSEGGSLCQEVILEAPEPFPEDDVDPFADRSSSPPVVVPRLVTRARTSSAKPARSTSLSLFGRTRSPTVGPSPSLEIPKSTTKVSLRRSVTSALSTGIRRHSTHPLLDDVPPPSPLNVTMHNGATIVEEASRINDDEVRRLSELAFL
ncbi:hypothetical protein BGW80DRAFT_1316665 [Lactifluus volemus]|nr:hypothetical protein BGW80DRAFT_1316665 [Lactifluus volemus]